MGPTRCSEQTEPTLYQVGGWLAMAGSRTRHGRVPSASAVPTPSVQGREPAVSACTRLALEGWSAKHGRTAFGMPARILRRCRGRPEPGVPGRRSCPCCTGAYNPFRLTCVVAGRSCSEGKRPSRRRFPRSSKVVPVGHFLPVVVAPARQIMVETRWSQRVCLSWSPAGPATHGQTHDLTLCRSGPHPLLSPTARLRGSTSSGRRP
jgi:hypothetical protein